MQKTEDSSLSIESILHENRKFAPPIEFSKTALVKSFDEYREKYAASIASPNEFWAKMATEHLHFFKKWDSVLNWNDYKAEWFAGSLINVAYNCLDRHILGTKKNKPALIWEGEPGDQRTFTYLQLHKEVSRCANMLQSLGVTAGDRVTLYLPMIPEAVISMLACARIGAVHNVVFGGFSSAALADRIQNSGSKILITADGGFRKGHKTSMKSIVDEACKDAKSLENIVVVARTHEKISMQQKRDVWWHELIEKQSTESVAKPFDAEHPLFILYTSGTTGKPKGLLHTSAGYLLGATVTSKYVFDLKETDIFWCTADVGWITGHSYLAYGPLSCGATILMYEGAPLTPNPDRFWQLIEKYKVTTLYTAPTALRTFIRLGDSWPEAHDLSSLRLLGSVGEPINAEAWLWYHKVIGKEKCPIVDTWWQTETGAMMITSLPGAIATKPGSATFPFFGIEPLLLQKDGSSVPKGHGGFLCIKKPWPAMARTIYGDHERYKKTYWQEIEGLYFTGDAAHQDQDGYYWIMGRIDDVINVSGHRLGTMEIESAIASHSSVAECAVVGRPDEVKGQGIVAFVTLKKDTLADTVLKESIQKLITAEIGALARPDEIRFTESLPKTRSGKIMRRLLRELAASGSITGDTSTLEDFSVLEKLRETGE